MEIDTFFQRLELCAHIASKRLDSADAIPSIARVAKQWDIFSGGNPEKDPVIKAILALSKSGHGADISQTAEVMKLGVEAWLHFSLAIPPLTLLAPMTVIDRVDPHV